MSSTEISPRFKETPARAYYRAHVGKLMIIEPKAGRDRSAEDFFHLDDVGTHPTGLLVTGIFQNDRRSHMMASIVRDANEEETEWHGRSGQ